MTGSAFTQGDADSGVDKGVREAGRTMSTASDQTVAPHRRGPRSKGPKLRGDILTAATELLVVAADSAEVSVRAVADRVGVTPTAIYLHFDDKNELIFECCRILLRNIVDEVLGRIGVITDPIERLRIAAHRLVQFGIEHPEPYRILFMSPPHAVPANLGINEHEGRVVFSLIRELVSDALGRTDPDHDDMHLRAMGLVAACHGVTALMIARSDGSITQEWPDLVELIDHILSVHLCPATE